MIDITRETVISLSDAARKLGVHIRTAREWAARIPTPAKPRLETAKAGGKRITSLEAVQRFLRHDSAESPAPNQSHLNAASLAKHNEALARLKERHGISVG